MKKEPEAVRKDYSFLLAMSTESLNEILCRDIDLDKDESDTDLILNVLEVLEARTAESGADTEMDMKTALNDLHDRARQRERMFADIKDVDDSENKVHIKRFWIKFAGIAAVIVLILAIGFTTATALGYDLWEGMAHWTKETFGFGENKSAFIADDNFSVFEETIIKNNISIAILPNWLPSQYAIIDTKEYDDQNSHRIVAMAVSDNDTLVIHITSYPGKDSGIRFYEMNRDSVWQYESNGIKHYIMENDEASQIVWARENFQIVLEFSNRKIDAKRIIDSIYGVN